MESKIVNDDYKVLPTFKKGVSGVISSGLALVVLSCVHGLTPAQSNAGFMLLVGLFQSLRNILKKSCPKLSAFF